MTDPKTTTPFAARLFLWPVTAYHCFFFSPERIYLHNVLVQELGIPSSLKVNNMPLNEEKKKERDYFIIKSIHLLSLISFWKMTAISDSKI